MNDETKENEKPLEWWLLILDDINCFVEWVRFWTIDVPTDFLCNCVSALVSKLTPKQKFTRKDLEGSKEDLDRWKEGKNIHYCLHNSNLSFFDTYIAVNGVPAFVFTKSASKKSLGDLVGPHASTGITNQGTSSSYNLETLSSSSLNAASVHKLTQYFKHRNPSERHPRQLDSFKKTVKETLSSPLKCSFSFDGTRLAVCYDDGRAVIWDCDHGVCMKRIIIGDTEVSDVSFLGKSNTVLLICTNDFKCWEWNIEGDVSELTEHLDTKVLSRITEEQVFWQRADFFANGTILVLSTLASCSEGCKLSIVLVHTTFENPMFIEHPYFLFPIRADFVISQVSMSPNGTGLLMSLIDQEMEDSYCIVWPDFQAAPYLYHKLDMGNVGSWSLDGEYVVTWIMTWLSDLEDINEGSAFIWSIEEISRNPDNHDYKFEYQMTNPFREQVFWCQIINCMKGKNRLIMGIVGETIRFLFWDMESMVHTHTIDTKIPILDMILCNKDAWIESYVKHKIVKGMSPVAVTQDGKYFGVVLGSPSQVLIWDTRVGVQVLNVSPKDLEANHFREGINFMASPSNRKFAIIGNEAAMVFCPSMPNVCKNGEKRLLESQMVELENQSAMKDKHSKFKMRFSGDGSTLGVICIGLAKMQLWNLHQGTDGILDITQLEEGIIRDFSISYNGKYLTTYTDKNIQVWKSDDLNSIKLIGVTEIDSEVVDMGIKDDASEILLCFKDGRISICYKQSMNEELDFDGENGASSRTPSIEGNSGQFTESPRSDLENPLLSHGDLAYKTPYESVVADSLNQRYPMSHWHFLCERVDNATFRVSPSFTNVIRVSNQKVQAWNLKSEPKMEDQIMDAKCIKRSSASYSSVSSISEHVSKILETVKNNLKAINIVLTEHTTVVQSAQQHIVVAANPSSLKVIQTSTQTSFNKEYKEGKYKKSDMVYIINLKDTNYRRRLCGRNLNPMKGLAISEDGRHVACFAGRLASKVVVWNVYASDCLLPDYHFLALNDVIGNEEVIKKKIVPMINFFGDNFVNCPHPNGLSILNEAMWFFNNLLAKTILQYAVKKKVKVSFLCPEMQILEHNNMLESSIDGRSPKVLEVTLNYLLKRVIHEAEVISILRQSLTHILEVYPQTFYAVITDPRILGFPHETEVPETILEERMFITYTSNSLKLTLKETKELWKNELKSNSIESSSAKVQAIVATLLYPNACRTAYEGLLHDLLVRGAQKNIFGSFIGKAIVAYKWKTYAARLMIYDVTHHAILLMVFTLYCFMVCTDGMYKIETHEGNEENSSATKYSLISCGVLAVPCLYRKFCLCILHVRHHGIYGFLCWLTSAWNLMAVLSYFNLVVVIPLLEFVFIEKGKKSVLISVLVATECVFLWCHVLYYARMSRKLGKYVTVIAAVVLTVIPFLFIAFCVMFGFAIAFHVLYRHVDVSIFKGGSVCEDDDFLLLHKSFGSFGRTLLTVFGYAFGQFDLDNIYHAPNAPAATILFVLYMVVITTTFLNMMIAIMGYEFEGIHRAEYSRFVQARAMVIDDIEMMMSRRMKERTNEKIGKYLHVLIPSHLYEKIVGASSPDSKEPEEMIEETIKTEFRRQFDELKRWIGRSYPPPAARPPLARSRALRIRDLYHARDLTEPHQAVVDTPDIEDPWYDSDSSMSSFSERSSDNETDG